jgi:hypothetical protein
MASVVGEQDPPSGIATGISMAEQPLAVVGQLDPSIGAGVPQGVAHVGSE